MCITSMISSPQIQYCIGEYLQQCFSFIPSTTLCTASSASTCFCFCFLWGAQNRIGEYLQQCFSFIPSTTLCTASSASTCFCFLFLMGSSESNRRIPATMFLFHSINHTLHSFICIYMFLFFVSYGELRIAREFR